MIPTKSIPSVIVMAFVALCFYACGDGRSRSRDDNATANDNEINSTQILPKPTLNVYIENSASMYGYVKGVTSFEQAVYNYLCDVKIRNIADSLNLFYINSKLIPQGSDISDFIEKLEPTTFKQKGGNLSTTDISNLLKTVFDKSGENEVSVLVSDFIFSPGKKDAEQYLVNQQIGIKSSVATFLNSNPNHGVIIYQLSSNFDGYFYDKFDKPYKFNGNRPYYIWIVGDKQYLGKLIKACPPADFKGDGVENELSMFRENGIVDYAVKYRSGNFRLDKQDPKHSIVDAKKDTKGRENKMRFSIDVDFSELLCQGDYLLDDDNYTLSDSDFDLEIVKNHSDSKYTHTLKLSSDIVKHSTLSITLKSNLPEWVEDITDDNGVGINDDNNDETFGFKYLVEGLYEGFTVNGDNYATIKVNINK